MLAQLLITLIVIALAVIYLRRRKASEQPAGNKAVEQFIADARKPANPWQQDKGQTQADPGLATASPMAANLKAVLWSVLAVSLIIGGTLSWLHWQDQQRMVTVLLYRDAGEAPVIYRVAKRDLGERSFTTADGTRVTVSANERIEIIGL